METINQVSSEVFGPSSAIVDLEEQQMLKVRENVKAYAAAQKAQGFSISEVLERYLGGLG